MSKKPIIQKLEQQQLKSDLPHFSVGDTIRVHTRIIEGDKERVQMFAGTVIARKGTGLGETVSLHRVAYGEGMEKVFPLHSPRIAQIEVVREGDVRKSKLYYLRGTSGKKAKVRSKIGGSRRKVAAVANAEEQEDLSVDRLLAQAPSMTEATAIAPEQMLSPAMTEATQETTGA